ncbi:hypothetical protein GWL_31950 [Herbaspirillum sp. GW103]|nr:hypothetical protein GWL_31950 [Herbaspirillum sp. GW103]
MYGLRAAPAGAVTGAPCFWMVRKRQFLMRNPDRFFPPRGKKDEAY